MTADLRDRFVGCLLGGAIGDALGAGIEFDSLADIRRRHGVVRDYVPIYAGAGSITDDTQMTLFTAEGLLCQGDPVEAIRLAYLRWLGTQSRRIRGGAGERVAGRPWLADVPALNSPRAPGNTCMSALHHGGRGTPQSPLNNSKGCGGVMRVAPIGLVSDSPFELAARAAALTHGHPSGYLSAGAFALIISRLVRGELLGDAIGDAVVALQAWEDAEETIDAIQLASDLADRVAQRGTPPTAEDVESLGGGWIGEEALSIALFCVQITTDPLDALVLAVNHSGDSDSTGSLVGNLLGAIQGTAALPPRLLDRLELRDVIEEVANDLADVYLDGAPRYSCDASKSSDTEFMQ